MANQYTVLEHKQLVCVCVCACVRVCVCVCVCQKGTEHIVMNICLYMSNHIFYIHV